MYSLSELLTHINQHDKIIIELGCGPVKTPGNIGIDKVPLHEVDYIADLEEGLPFLPDRCVDEYIAFHSLEHIENLELLLRDIHRTLKPQGILKVTAPHFSNPYYYSDYTHKKFFGLYTFDYFSVKDSGYKRKVPDYYTSFHFEVVERKFVFKSPFYFRNLIKQVLNRLINSCKYIQELYEENLCFLIPTQEIRFIVKPDLAE